MRKSLLLAIALYSAVHTNVFSAEPDYPKFSPSISYKKAQKKAVEILKNMTMDEKLRMISGGDGFVMHGIERLGIPSVRMSDATAGIQLHKMRPDRISKSVAFPAPVALAATWNKELTFEMAESIGEECNAAGISVLLGPGFNIYRVSQSGRNFEYFGEDPYLVSRMVENYVVGLQSQGVMATLKHFICNNNEHNRRIMNAQVDERTIHEIYLPAFKAGVDAGALAVMTSYNKLNGEYTAESSYVINELLRKELGFQGLVMSDWWSVYNPELGATSGLDIEMPGDDNKKPFTYLKRDVPDCIEEGKVTVENVNSMVKRILTAQIMMGFDKRDINKLSTEVDYARHEKVAYDIASESVTLLKNENSVLPLGDMCGKKILLSGCNATEYVSGRGAAEVKGYDFVSLYEAMTELYGNSVKYRRIPTNEDIQSVDVVIFNTGIFETEGGDRPFELSEEEIQQIQRISKLNKNVVVVLNLGGGVKTEPWINNVPGLLMAYYPGQNGNRAVAKILKGEINPSGKLPFTIEKNFSDSPAYGYMPIGETFYPQWSREQCFDQTPYTVDYKEGVFVGYRWYDKKDIKPAFAFGHGLSYTDFEYSDLTVKNESSGKNVKFIVKVKVKNMGKVPGSETVQMYIHDEASALERPEKELKGFKKVFLQPGEKKEISLLIDKSDLSYYNPEKKGWICEKGDFEVMIGSSSDRIILTQRISY